jgi:uncharacterized membrane protein
VASGESFRVGRVFSTTFQAIFERWQSVGVFALIVSVVMAIVNSFTTMQAMAGYDPAVPNTAIAMFSSPLYYVGSLLGIVSYAFIQAGSYYGFTKQGDGQDVSISDCFNAAARYFLPMLGAIFLGVLGFFAGYLLFIIPAFIVATMWSVSGAALVAEGLGPTECLGRSRALTKGIRWPVFGCLFLFGIAYVLIFFGLQGFQVNGLLSLYQTSPMLGIVAATAFSTMSGLFATSFFAALYRETVLVKEGGDTRELAEIFA